MQMSASPVRMLAAPLSSQTAITVRRAHESWSACMVRQGPRPGADGDERGAGARQRHVQQRHLRRALADELQPGRQHAVAWRPGAAPQLSRAGTGSLRAPRLQARPRTGGGVQVQRCRRGAAEASRQRGRTVKGELDLVRVSPRQRPSGAEAGPRSAGTRSRSFSPPYMEVE